MSSRELLSNRRLQAVVVVNAVEPILLQTLGGETQIRHTSVGVRNGIGCDAVDRVGWTGQVSRVDVVAVIHDVDATGSNIGHFKNVLTDELPLNAQVVLPNQGCLDVVVKRGIEIRALQCGEIEPAGQYLQRAVGKWALQTGRFRNDGQGIGVRSSFLNVVNHAIDTHTVVEDAGATANNKAASSRRLPGQTNAWREIA